MALATPNQLWRLNKLGRLVVVPGSTPMTHVDADLAIKAAMSVEDVLDVVVPPGLGGGGGSAQKPHSQP